MRVKLVVVAGLVGSLVVASGASAANMWRTNHGHGSGGSTSATVSSNSGPTFNGDTNGGTNGGTNGNGSNGYTGGSNGSVGVAEPTSLYAMGSALALLGAAGWTLRRRK